MAKKSSVKQKKSVTSRLEIAKQNLAKRRNKKRNKIASRSGRSKGSKKKGKSAWKSRLVKVTLVLVGIFLFFSAIATVYAISYVQSLDEELPSLEEPFGKKPQVTQIYARDVSCAEDDASDCDYDSGTLLYRVFDEFNADPVDIDDLPEHVKWAFLAAEDRSFYTHPGFDAKGIVNCAIANVRSGETACGGSTITQQFLKLTVFSDEPPIERKIKELLMATKIEQAYEKDEILQLYLTVTSYGSSVTGVETAADFYFDKDAKDLTLAEASILAAIIQNPANLSPTVPSTTFYNAETATFENRPLEEVIPEARARLTERQVYILDQLDKNLDSINKQIKDNLGDEYNEETDKITEEMVDEARIAELEYAKPIATDIKAGHFVDYVLDELTTKNYKNGEEPFTRAELNTGGYKIITTLDYEQQQAAEKATARGGNDFTGLRVNNAALMTIDPQTGQVLSMAGSKAYAGESSGCNAAGEECQYDPQVNVLTSLNEPGSTAKSLAYTLAFEEGKFFGASNVPDIAITYPELNYEPKNWNGQFAGPNMTIRTALQQSLNIPALQVLESIGLEAYLDGMQNLGYTTVQRDAAGPSAVLGGISVKYIEHVNAYAAFANGGNYIPSESILKIIDRDGNVVYEADVEKTQIFSEQAAYMLNDILYNLQNISGETGLTLFCKTGTTEDNIEALQICWNKNQVTIAWAGNNNNDPLDPFQGYPIYAVQPWLADYYREINGLGFYEGKDPNINAPGFLLQGNGCSSDDASCVSSGADWYISGNPAPTYKERKTVTVCKDQKDKLAREVDKLLGYSETIEITRYISPIPRWQDTLDQHILKTENRPNKIPTEECTIDRNEESLGPIFSINSPTDGSLINGNQIKVTGSAKSASGSISSVEFYLDGTKIGEANSFANINETLSVDSNLDDGTYTFEAVATDSSGKTTTYTASLVKGDGISSNFNFTLPTSPQALGVTIGGGDTQTIQVNYSGASNVVLYEVNVNTGDVRELGAMSGSGPSTYAWGADITAGEYAFYVTATIGNSGFTQSEQSGSVLVQ